MTPPRVVAERAPVPVPSVAGEHRVRVPTCPACLARDAVAVGRSPDVRLVRCPRCTLVYSWPQPAARVRRKYLVEYDLAGHFGPLAARKRVLYERRLAALPAPGPGRDRLCDVGCGDGQFLALAAARGWKPHGVEPNPPAARRAADAGARVRLGLLEDLDDLEWGSFDLVTCWDVLEHTPEPRHFAERLVRLLAPDGWLALTTLNFRSLARLVFGMRWSMVCEDHFTYWTAPSLIALFRSLGMVILRVDNFGLGRDFVTVLDRLWPSRADGARPYPLRPRRAWDVAAPTLLVERLLNRCFRLVGGGVGLGLTMRRPALPDGSSRGVS